jgi:uncharacterized membrane protein YhaH (DUF805 family)
MIDRLFWLLLSFRGRIGRATFALLSLAQLVVWVICEIALWRHYMVVTYDAAHKARVAIDAPPAVRAILFLLSAVAIWVSLAVQIKRLHDFNWSGWWLAAPVGGAFVGGLLGGLLAALHVAGGLVLVGLLFAVAGVGSFVLVMIMFFRAGDPGDNGHPRGPDEDAPASRGFASSGCSLAPARRVLPPAPSPAGFGRPRTAQTFGRRGAGR